MAQKVYCLIEQSGWNCSDVGSDETNLIGIYSSKELAIRGAEKYIKEGISALDADERPNDFSYDLDELFNGGIDISAICIRSWGNWSDLYICEYEIDTYV